jgi:hypothetical protein
VQHTATKASDEGPGKADDDATVGNVVVAVGQAPLLDALALGDGVLGDLGLEHLGALPVVQQAEPLPGQFVGALVVIVLVRHHC